ncbi:enoyl-CoA hydratase/isomerase family protein [Streptomyces sp. NPDC005917]|uniref:enoyl-CoA hydratase/isomerase family protein n=1 Tax=unclassified Streptomyces TaxID=2593676 RepID=UPI0033CB1203
MTKPTVLKPPVELKTLRVRELGTVLAIELNMPGQGNVVTDAMLDDLQAVLDRQEPDIRAVVLAGAGEDFCVGGDRTEHAESLLLDPAGGGVRASGHKARRVCESLASNPAVTIARIHGKAIGAGLALALACDLRVAADTATFRLPELAFGLPAAWGGLLPRLLSEIGPACARELILTGRSFDAAEALSLSLLQKVVPASSLDAAVEGWINPLLRRPATALRVTKSLFNSYAAAARLADVSALDPELMAAAMIETEQVRANGAGFHRPHLSG